MPECRVQPSVPDVHSFRLIFEFPKVLAEDLFPGFNIVHVQLAVIWRITCREVDAPVLDKASLADTNFVVIHSPLDIIGLEESTTGELEDIAWWKGHFYIGGQDGLFKTKL